MKIKKYSGREEDGWQVAGCIKTCGIFAEGVFNNVYDGWKYLVQGEVDPAVLVCQESKAKHKKEDKK